MTITITKIIGFVPGESRFSAPGKRFQQEETVRVLCTTEAAIRSSIELVAQLPVYGAPGTSLFNPEQLTFTWYQSRHPSYTRMYLDDVISVSKVDGISRAYDVKLVYRVPEITQNGTQSAPKEERRDQKMLKPELDDPAQNTPITVPTARPPIYGRTARVVLRDSYRDADGDVIKQPNGLPIRNPVKVPVVEIVHSWTWNMSWPPNFSTLKSLEGKVNQDELTLGSPLTIAAEKAKVEPFSLSEEYETPANSTTVYHYARVTMTLIECELGWEDKIPAMATMQRKAIGSDEMVPIKINTRGDLAREPWPLDADGIALTVAEVTSGDMSRLAFLDTGFPEKTNVNPFMDTHLLKIKSA